MSASANPALSTMAFAAEAPEVGLPVVKVTILENTGVLEMKWGESVSEKTSMALSATFTGVFHAVDSYGHEPFLKTFHNLILCDGGVLTIGMAIYRIRVENQQPNEIQMCGAAIGANFNIAPNKFVNLSVHKLEVLTPANMETLRYYIRDGVSELCDELVKPKMGKNIFNVSLIGHTGAGKSNLVWAVAHHLVSIQKATVLWAGRHDASDTWVLRLFECDENDIPAVYELANAPKTLKEILKQPILALLQVLILDAPTRSKSAYLTSNDGVAAFEWAGKEARIVKRRVIHTSSLGGFSLDERAYSYYKTENKSMRPWTRQDFVEAMSDDVLRAQVCKTLTNMPPTSTAEAVVDAKLFYSGINARWFFNFSIDEIKIFSQDIITRMPVGAVNDRVSRERAVKSAMITFWEDDRQITLFTSQYLAFLLGKSKEYSTKFFRLFPLLENRLGNGGAGEIFEADFLVNLEHCHGIAGAQRVAMGKDRAQQVNVRLGIDVSNNEEVRWPAGKLFSLPKNRGDRQAAQPMPHQVTGATKRVPRWFIPEDNGQPFLDFFVLIPAEDSTGWTLRVIQSMVSKRHKTDLSQLKLVLLGIETAGFSLALGVDVAFMIEDRAQNKVGQGIDKRTVEVTLPNIGCRQSGGIQRSMKEFSINVLHILFKQTGAVP